jgi:hypothetical protein
MRGFSDESLAKMTFNGCTTHHHFELVECHVPSVGCTVQYSGDVKS